MSFAEAETIQLHDFARSKASGATVSTLTGPAGSRGTAVVSGEIRPPNSAPPTISDRATTYAPPPVIVRTPPPAGQEIAASDGDRVIVDDDARVQIVRRRQATIRTIYSQEQRLLIMLADYAKPGQFPDGIVDTTFNFYELEGDWPLEPRWEALTTLFQYEGDPQVPTGYAVATPPGLVHLAPGRPGLRAADSAAISVLWYRGSNIGQRRGWSFAEAEKFQLAEAANSNARPT